MTHATDTTSNTSLSTPVLDPAISDYNSELIHAYFDLFQVIRKLPRVKWIPIFKLNGYLKLPLVRLMLLLLVSSHIKSRLSALEKAYLINSSLHPKGQTKDFWDELRAQAKSMREALPGILLPGWRISLAGFALILVGKQLVPQEYFSSAISLIFVILSFDMEGFSKLSNEVVLQGIVFIIVVWAIMTIPFVYHFRIKRTLYNRYKPDHLEMLHTTILSQFVRFGEITISQSIYSLEKRLFDAIGEPTHPEMPLDVWAVYSLCGVGIMSLLYVLRVIWGGIEVIFLILFYLTIFLLLIYKVWRNAQRRLSTIDVHTS